MEKKEQTSKWLYAASGKSFRCVLCVLTFCAWMAGVIFATLGVLKYGTDILVVDRNSYVGSTIYETDMLLEANNVLSDIYSSYVGNEEFDKDFSITNVSEDIIYYYDMKAIIKDFKKEEFDVEQLSDLDPYITAIKSANMDGFTNYKKVANYLSNCSQNNYIYFNKAAFKKLFTETGEVNTDHRFSDLFSEEAYFLFEDIEYNEEKNAVDTENSTELADADSILNVNYAVYDPVDNLYYSPSDDYFKPMDSYIYTAWALKDYYPYDEFYEDADSTVFIWLRGYNYTVSDIWNNMISGYLGASQSLKNLDDRMETGSFVYYFRTSKYTCSNVSKMEEIIDLPYVYAVKGDNSDTRFHENVQDPLKLENYENQIGFLLDEFPEDFVFYFGVDPARSNLTPDRATWNYKNYNLFADTLGIVIWVDIILFVLIVLQMISLIKTTGRNAKDDRTVSLNFYDRLPTELWVFFTCSILGILVLLVLLVFGLVNPMEFWGKLNYLVSAGVMASIPFGLAFILLTLSFARRIKVHNFWDHLFMRKAYRFLKRKVNAFWNERRSSEKVLFIFTIYVVLDAVNIILAFKRIMLGFWMFMAVQVIAGIVVYHWIKDIQTIEDGISEITDGNYDYKCKLKRKRSLFKTLANGINHIADGLKDAVETSIKNERMRTELITNVSHDLKTPLTSIINYVNLLKTEKMPTKEAEHYVEVLDKKAQRLRHLTEDLVEAAKANTGNIELVKMPLAFDELMRQAIGEFEDKFTERDLTIVADYPESTVMVMADGRRMFRIIENVLQNVYKYALGGTRVYADLVKVDGQIIFTLKNISAAPLNISADALMERFTRGDSSRTTEGSGLGLSIAKDLTKLQEGTFEIQLDGDLFKVIITFPEYVKAEEV